MRRDERDVAQCVCPQFRAYENPAVTALSDFHAGFPPRDAPLQEVTLGHGLDEELHPEHHAGIADRQDDETDDEVNPSAQPVLCRVHGTSPQATFAGTDSPRTHTCSPQAP